VEYCTRTPATPLRCHNSRYEVWTENSLVQQTNRSSHVMEKSCQTQYDMGFKAPRGYGWLTNPKRAAYNRVYNRTSFSADPFIGLGIGLLIALIAGIFYGIASLFSSSSSTPTVSATSCPRCSSPMILRNGSRGQFYGCSRFPRCRGTRDYTPNNQLPSDTH
jgi:hypothetical protein